MASDTAISELLRKAQSGDKEALDMLLPVVYNELRVVAKRHLAQERSDHTLQATALVHEAYMRLLEQTQVNWENRLHFFSIASQMMRRILVNYAVERNAKKRGSGATRIELDENIRAESNVRELDVVLLNESLERLEQLDDVQARIVELRFFGGLTIPETAAVINMSPATVKREWRMAKAWLQVQMQS